MKNVITIKEQQNGTFPLEYVVSCVEPTNLAVLSRLSRERKVTSEILRDIYRKIEGGLIITQGKVRSVLTHLHENGLVEKTRGEDGQPAHWNLTEDADDFVLPAAYTLSKILCGEGIRYDVLYSDKRPFWGQTLTRSRVLETVVEGAETTSALVKKTGLKNMSIVQALRKLSREKMVKYESISGGKPQITYSLGPKVETPTARAYKDLVLQILDFLASSNAPCSSKDVALGIKYNHPANVSTLLSSLSNEGYVQRSFELPTGKRTAISVLNKGKRAYKKIILPSRQLSMGEPEIVKSARETYYSDVENRTLDHNLSLALKMG